MGERTMKTVKFTNLLIAGVCTLAVTGCYNSRPEFTPIDQSINEMTREKIVPTTVMLPAPEERLSGSLWRPGSKQFFRDQRAQKVGDILTVIVAETATANSEANTDASRVTNSTGGVTNLLNLEGKLTSRGIAPGIASLFDVDSDRDFEGEAKTDRKDSLNARIAAVVTQVLPNGNLVVQGKREVVINYELQELTLQGIVRPGDITKDNTIASDKIAEARISYAGRGVVDESQTPQPGVRFIDKWMPF